jgi:protein SCO1/2
MAELKKFADLWSDAESSKELDIILATVDPNNDDPSALKEYLANFNPNFIGLTGHQVDLAGLAESLFVGYGDPAATSNHFPGRGEHGTAKGLESYAIDHSSHISVISPEAQLVAVIRPPHRARDLLKALELIIASH